MYENKRSDISEVVNIYLIRRDDPDNPTLYHSDACFTHFTKKEDCQLDPTDIIEVTETDPVANIDDAKDRELLIHDSDSEHWEDYQKRCEIEVDKPYDEFFKCGYKIMDLLRKHCKSAKEVQQVLGVLTAHYDYTHLPSISLLYDLSTLMLSYHPAVKTHDSDETQNSNPSSKKRKQREK